MQIFLLKAKISQEFLIILKNNFIFSWKYFSWYTLNKELLKLNMLDYYLIHLNPEADF